MAAQLLEGKIVAQKVYQEILPKIKQLKEKGVNPTLTFLRVGEDAASQIYVGMKDKKAAELGLLTQTQVLPITISETELLTFIQKFNTDPKIHGILLQAPLPSHLKEQNFFKL